ncbi:MAG TPA: hypothetical protein VF228_09385 [Iamia sp.]
MGRRIVTAVLAAAVVVGLVACEPAPPETLPGPHGSGRTPLVYVYGDSLAPVADYREQAEMSGYELVSEATGGSWMCGGHQIPQDDATRWWPRILQTIAEVQPDYLILQYQAWANYQLRCGGRPEQFPYTTSDPGRGWRVYLQMFVDAAVEAGGRTRIVVVETPSAPASKPEWVEPMAIMDQASRTMATRLPDHITFVPIRQDLTRNGAYTAFAPCKGYDEGYTQQPQVSCWDQSRAGDWPAGQVRLRSGDAIHYWCRTGGGVCAGSTPAGLRIRRSVFTVLNQLEQAGPQMPDSSQASASSSG